MKKIQENFCRTGNVCLALTSDVAAQRMIGRNLHENEVNAVRIGDPHFVQSPRFGAGLPSNRDAAGGQLLLDRVNVADLQPQCAGKRRGIDRTPVVPGDLDDEDIVAVA